MSIYLPIAQMSVDVWSLLLLGGMTGILSGVFGIGGGFLMTPLLIFLGIPPPVAVASVANQIIASSTSAFHTHWRRGNVDFRMGVLLLGGGIVGSTFGVWLFSFLKELGQIDLVISIGYVLFLSLIGGSMALESGRTILQQRRDKHRAAVEDAEAAEAELTRDSDTVAHTPDLERGEEGQTEAPPKRLSPMRRFFSHLNIWSRLPFVMRFPRSGLQMSALIPIMLSAVIGVLVSILGIGGGFFMIPAMLYILKMPASVVVGTSLFQVIFVTSNVTILHALTTQTVDVILAVLLLLGSTTGAQLGSRVGLKLPEEYLRAMLASIVLVVAIQLGINLVTTPDHLYSVTFGEAATP